MIKSLLKVELAKNDMTQKELAEKTGVRLPTISDMVTGKTKHISLDNIEKICNVLNCDISDIYRYIPDNE